MAKENDSWNGLQSGDLVQYKDRQFLFRGINPDGGPGMKRVPEPVLGMPRPSVTYEFYIDYYLRNQQNQPHGIPQEMLESAPPMRLGHLSYAAFLNATRADLEKIKHISENEWKKMIIGLQKGLAKVANEASRVIARALSNREYYIQGDIDHLHLVSNPPIFGVGGCGCGCAPAFQFYLDENDRIGISLPTIYESNFWSDDEQKTKQRSLEVEVREKLDVQEVVFALDSDPKPPFLEPFMRY